MCGCGLDDAAQKGQEDHGQGNQGRLGRGHRVELAVEPGSREFAVGGARASGQGQAGDRRHADAGPDQGLGDVVGGRPEPDTGSERGLGGCLVELLTRRADGHPGLVAEFVQVKGVGIQGGSRREGVVVGEDDDHGVQQQRMHGEVRGEIG